MRSASKIQSYLPNAIKNHKALSHKLLNSHRKGIEFTGEQTGLDSDPHFLVSAADLTVHLGDVIGGLNRLDDRSVQTCITSPPYYGLRDYGCVSQIGLEATLNDYVAKLRTVFELVRRKLRDDGSLWLNVGDFYAGGGRGPSGETGFGNQERRQGFARNPVPPVPAGFKPKDLVLVTAMLMAALIEAGWYLRSEIIWQKPNAMPGSQRDRPTLSHEKLYLLSKNSRYLYNHNAVRMPLAGTADDRTNKVLSGADGKTLRTVWTIPVSRGGHGHFATFPEELVRRCLLLTSKPGHAVLDCFAGTGTTGRVALANGRKAILIELNPSYIATFIRQFAGFSEKEP